MAMEEVTTSPDGVWRMDVDAFVPKPEGYIKLKGVEYPIYSFLDVPIVASLKVARLAEDLKAEDSDYAQRLERSIQQIMMLNEPGEPRLTREMFEDVPPREIVRLTVLVSSIARIPLKTDLEKSGESAGSPSPSPASVASTAGGSVSSSV